MGNSTSVASPTDGSSSGSSSSCNIVAAIDCLILNEKDIPIRECDDLLDPRTIKCTNANPATGLSFRYLGSSSSSSSYPDEVYITVAGGRTGDVFAGVVQMNDTFEAKGDFRGEAVIDIFTVNDATATEGTLLETLTLDTYCDTMSKLTLTNMFGPLELVGFQNAVGKLSSIQTAQLTYYVANDAPESIDAATVAITSALQQQQQQQQPFYALDTPMPLKGNERGLLWPFDIGSFQSVYTEKGTIDFGEMFQSGSMLTFSMEATGRSNDGTECTDQAQFTF